MAAKLPYDAEVEYIETDGASYLDTGIYPDHTTKMEAVWCAETNQDRGWGCLNNGGVARWHAGTYNDFNVGISAGVTNSNYRQYGSLYRIIVDAVSKSWSMPDLGLGGSLEYVTGQFSIVRSFTFGARNYTSKDLFGKHKLASLKFWKSGNVVFDGIAVRVGTVGYMYDRVSGQLFGNSGTGAFILGPDIRLVNQSTFLLGSKTEVKTIYTARDYVQDGLVALWDGIENAGWGVHDPTQRYWIDLIGGSSIGAWGWNDTCGWDGFSYNALNRVDYGKIQIDFSNGMTIECHSGEFRVENQAQCVGVIGGNGYSDNTQYICVGGNNFGWIRNVVGFSDYLHYVDRGRLTQSVTIGTSGKLDFFADGGVRSVSIPESSFVMPTGRTALMTFMTKTRSTTVGAPTFNCARIYNRILTPSELAHNYLIDQRRFSL